MAPDEPQHAATAEAQDTNAAEADGYHAHPEVADTFARTVDEGDARLHRTWTGLIATGMVGGMDVGVGLLALLLVLHGTGQPLLAALAFGIGFIALALAGSELFTEDFLVPVSAVIGRRRGALSLLRLWSLTLLANLVGGWVMSGLILMGLPQLREQAITLGRHYIELGISREAFGAALLGGIVITLTTWMQHATEQVGARIVAAVCGAFLLAAGPLDHSIVGSLEMFAALHAGAPFGYRDWLGAFALATVGNAIGGLALVTALRLLQAGDTVQRVRSEQPPDEAVR